MASSGSGTVTPVVTTPGAITEAGLHWQEPTPRTLLPITRYAEIMQIALPHFWQLNGNKAPVVSGCGDDSIWDQTARNSLAWTILQAEEMIAEFLGFWPAPKYITDEEIAFGLTGVRSNWGYAEVKTRWAYIQGYGTETLTAKLEGATVTYDDLDGDPNGREETATINVASVTACNSTCEVAVFHTVANGARDAADPDWEIRPIKVDIDGTTMTIRAEASLFVKPTLLSLTKADSYGSPDTDAWKIDYDTDNFVSTVDVYCRTLTTSTPVTLQWDGVCDCTSICSHRTQTACAYRTDNKRGYFAPRPATWNGTSNIEAAPTYRMAPESLLVNYQAGYPLNSRSCRMRPDFERAIVKLTNALLPEPPCGFCGQAETRWRDDRKDIDPLTPEAASMPWDLYKRGALEAWRIVKLYRMGRGIKLGR